MVEEFNEKQFQAGFNNIVGKKLLEMRQANEWTKVNNAQEGYCYMCLKKDWVSATIVDICFKCASKKGMETILAIVKRFPYGYCYDHGGYCVLEYKNNIAQLNVRLCRKCTDHVAAQHKALRKKGTHKVDPFWLKMRKQHGKDYRSAGYFDDGSTRR